MLTHTEFHALPIPQVKGQIQINIEDDHYETIRKPTLNKANIQFNLRNAKDLRLIRQQFNLKPRDTLGLVLDELAEILSCNNVTCSFSTHKMSFIALYRKGIACGAHITYRRVQELIYILTDVSCFLKYQADGINYPTPPPARAIIEPKFKPALDYGVLAAHSTSPLQVCENRKERMKDRLIQDEDVFLRRELDNLIKEANRTHFIKRDNSCTRFILGDKIKDYIKAGLSYAKGERDKKPGEGVHTRYDATLNQLLFQMHLWGFRQNREVRPREGSPEKFCLFFEDTVKQAYRQRRNAALKISSFTNWAAYEKNPSIKCD